MRIIYNSKFILIFTFSIFISLVPICFAHESPKLRVGVILPLTGAFARYGQLIQTSLEKMRPASVSFIYEDEGCNGTKALSAYKKLSDLDGINFFLGPWCGSPQMLVAHQIKNRDQLTVVGSSAPSAVFAVSGEKMFSSQHTIEAESTFVGEQMNRLGHKKIVLVFFENDFSRAHEAAFRKVFKGEIMDTFAYTSDDVSQLKVIALKAKQLGVDAVYAPDAFPLMSELMKELKIIGLGKLRVFAVYSAQAEDVLKVVGEQEEQLLYSYPDIGDKDAFQYFPPLAAEMLLKALVECGENVTCAKQYLKTHYQFDANGALEGKFVLKTIREGEFREFGG